MPLSAVSSAIKWQSSRFLEKTAEHQYLVNLITWGTSQGHLAVSSQWHWVSATVVYDNNVRIYFSNHLNQVICWVIELLMFIITFINFQLYCDYQNQCWTVVMNLHMNLPYMERLSNVPRVVSTSWFFRFIALATQRMPLVEQELLTFLEHLVYPWY